MDVQEKIKRPKNAYLLFSNDRRPAMKKLYPNATNLEIFEKYIHISFLKTSTCMYLYTLQLMKPLFVMFSQWKHQNGVYVPVRILSLISRRIVLG